MIMRKIIRIAVSKEKDYGRGFACGIRWQKEYRYAPEKAPHESIIVIGFNFWKWIFGIHLYLDKTK